MSERMTEKEFTHRAIPTLRSEKSKGIHCVFSGFNEAAKAYFNIEDTREMTARLEAEGHIVTRPVKGGVMLYLPGDEPGGQDPSDTLAKMGL